MALQTWAFRRRYGACDAARGRMLPPARGASCDARCDALCDHCLSFSPSRSSACPPRRSCSPTAGGCDGEGAASGVAASVGTRAQVDLSAFRMAVPLGLPRPVQGSKPGPASHWFGLPSVMLFPSVMSRSAPAETISAVEERIEEAERRAQRLVEQRGEGSPEGRHGAGAADRLVRLAVDRDEVPRGRVRVTADVGDAAAGAPRRGVHRDVGVLLVGREARCRCTRRRAR